MCQSMFLHCCVGKAPVWVITQVLSHLERGVCLALKKKNVLSTTKYIRWLKNINISFTLPTHISVALLRLSRQHSGHKPSSLRCCSKSCSSSHGSSRNPGIELRCKRFLWLWSQGVFVHKYGCVHAHVYKALRTKKKKEMTLWIREEKLYTSIFKTHEVLLCVFTKT